MNTRRVLVIISIILVAIAAIWGYLTLTPTVVSFSPLETENYQPHTVNIEITFSRKMKPDSVLDRISITPRVAGDFTWESQILKFTPVEAWESGTAVRVRLAAGAKSTLGLEIQEDSDWRFNVSPTQLAYLWEAGENAEIYTLDPVTGETRQVTNAGNVLSFAVGIEGRLLYYSTENQQGGSDIFTIDRLQGTVTKVFSCGQYLCTDIALSPLNTMIAYLKNDSEIWLYRLDDKEEERVSRSGHKTRLPMWSPDGRLSYYDATAQGYIVLNVDSGERKTLKNQTGETGTWSPEGRVFVAPETYMTELDILRGPSGEADSQEVDENDLDPVRVLTSRLLSYDPDTGRYTNLTSEELTEDIFPVFSPNGRWLVFARRYLDDANWTSGRQVWLLEVGKSSTQTLTHAAEFKYTAFAWHPTLDQFASVRFNAAVITDPPEIWLIELNGTATRLIIGGYAPQWIP